MKDQKTNPNADREITKPVTRKKYTKPVLSLFGEVRDITLGPTAGLGESGNPTIFRPPGVG